MEDLVRGLEMAMGALRDRLTGPHGVVGGVDELAPAQLMAAVEALGVIGRRLDGLRATVAAEVDRASRSELGADSLAKQQGYRNAASLLAAVTGIGHGEAKRLIGVGKAIAPRLSLIGEAMPALHPHVAEAVAEGRLGAVAAGHIVTMLDRVALRTSVEARDTAEKILAGQAPGLPLDDVRALVRRAEAWLDPDGLEPAERDRRGEDALSMYERDGFLCFDGKVEASRGAPVKAALEAIVSADFRAARADVIEDDDATRRTAPQRQMDALIQLAEHAISCTHNDLPLDTTTVVVRMDLETLVDGIGVAEIDGLDEPLSAGSARLLASSAGVIPCVLGGRSEILDWGRRKRLFTPAQKLALVERDGGCAMCHRPPGMTKAHHLDWWARDRGRTDIDKGVLLCEPCHHRVHDNGWEIRIEGTGVKAKVWFIPPATVDPMRVPRLGGRARFDYVLVA